MTLMHATPDAVPPGVEGADGADRIEGTEGIEGIAGTEGIDGAVAVTTTAPDTAPSRALPDAWSTQRALRAEKAQLVRWRRLLRARLDLTVAGFAPPEPLGLTTWGTVPDAVEATRDLPDAALLQAAVAGMTSADPVELMTHLRDLDRSLGRYDRWVDGALEESLQDSLTRLADDAGR